MVIDAMIIALKFNIYNCAKSMNKKKKQKCTNANLLWSRRGDKTINEINRQLWGGWAEIKQKGPVDRRDRVMHLFRCISFRSPCKRKLQQIKTTCVPAGYDISLWPTVYAPVRTELNPKSQVYFAPRLNRFIHTHNKNVWYSILSHAGCAASFR